MTKIDKHVNHQNGYCERCERSCMIYTSHHCTICYKDYCEDCYFDEVYENDMCENCFLDMERLDQTQIMQCDTVKSN
jgi:hypothetical protein